MRRNVFIFVCAIALLATAVLEAQDAPKRKDLGAIGDVKLSLLGPKEFQNRNGDGWILMQPLNDKLKNEALQGKFAEFFQATGLKDVPDGRGVFLRGMNMGRNGGTGDPSGDSRAVGSSQTDAFAKHDHGGGDHSHPHGSSHWPNGGMYNNNRHYLAGGDQGHTNGKFAIRGSGRTIVAQGEAETRPRNVSVYVYVKVR